MSRVLLRCAALLALPVALSTAACTNQEEPEVPVVPGETTEPAQTGDPTTADGSSTTGEPSGDPTDANVPFECSDLMTAGRVVQILQAPLDGETRRIYNDDFLEDSGRTGRLTCSYGTPVGNGSTASPAPDGPAVEIAVSSYVDEETAAGRIDRTLGATSRDVKPQTIAGIEGYLLTGKNEVTFIVADGVRTYVITLRRSVVPKAAELVVILDLAAEALGVPAATPES